MNAVPTQISEKENIILETKKSHLEDMEVMLKNEEDKKNKEVENLKIQVTNAAANFDVLGFLFIPELGYEFMKSHPKHE